MKTSTNVELLSVRGGFPVKDWFGPVCGAERVAYMSSEEVEHSFESSIRLAELEVCRVDRRIREDDLVL